MNKNSTKTIIYDKYKELLDNSSGKQKNKMDNLINNFPYEIIIETIKICLNQYIKGDYCYENIKNFYSKLLGVANNISKSPYEQEIKRVCNFTHKEFDIDRSTVLAIIKSAKETLDFLDDDSFEIFLKEVAALVYKDNITSFEQWRKKVEEIIEKKYQDWRNVNAE